MTRLALTHFKLPADPATLACQAHAPKKTQKIRKFFTCRDLGQALQLVSYQDRTLDVVVVNRKQLGFRFDLKLALQATDSTAISTLRNLVASQAYRLAGYRFA
jgi:hypothetical protein